MILVLIPTQQMGIRLWHWNFLGLFSYYPFASELNTLFRLNWCYQDLPFYILLVVLVVVVLVIGFCLFTAETSSICLCQVEVVGLEQKAAGCFWQWRNDKNFLTARKIDGNTGNEWSERKWFAKFRIFECSVESSQRSLLDRWSVYSYRVDGIFFRFLTITHHYNNTDSSWFIIDLT